MHALLGGKLRESVEFASYLFFRYADPVTGKGEVRTPEQLVANARGAQGRPRLHARTSSKAACTRPPTNSPVTARWPASLSGRALRYDPNSALSLARRDRVRRAAIEDLRNDYFEDPVWGMRGMRKRCGNSRRCRIATNTVVVNFEQLAANVRVAAVDVILLDTTFWGGIRPCVKAAGVCETMGLRVAVHSSGELGIQLATMLHLGAVLPNLGYCGRRALPPPRRRRDRGRPACATWTARSACPTRRGWG